MKDAGEIMEILEAYDLVGTYRGAAELAGCDHHTVKHYVERRERGLPTRLRPCRGRRSSTVPGQDRGARGALAGRHPCRCGARQAGRDGVHRARTARPAGRSLRPRRSLRGGAASGVSAVDHRAGRLVAVRLGLGPEIAGRQTLLFCAWLAWSRFRVVIPVWDRTLPTTLSCLDETFRRMGASRPTC
jgi:hypothetical protein